MISASSDGSELEHRPESHDPPYVFSWTRDGKLLTDRDNKLNRLDPATGQQDAVLADSFPSSKFASDQITGFRWSPDGKKLALLRGHVHSDVVLIREAAKQ